MKQKKMIIIIGSIVIALILSNILMKPTEVESKEDVVDVPSYSTVFVDIKGAVTREGVYEVRSDQRVYEVIEVAGGLLHNADTSHVNLSLIVYDTMVISIPYRSDESDDKTSNLISINYATLEELMEIPGFGQTKAQAVITYRETNGLFQSIEDIKLVSGIGDATFEAIKAYISL